MLIELHLLQSFPVSNLNRDDLGQPKTARFGGYTRARISSQSLKSAARRMFDTHGLETADLGMRTKRLCEAAAEIYRQGAGEDPGAALDIVRAGFADLGYDTSSEGLGEYLIFVDPRVAPVELAHYCAAHAARFSEAVAKKRAALRKAQDKARKENKKVPEGFDFEAEAKAADKTKDEAKKLFDGSRAADIALFGRMVATNTDFNVNAASQVAHALSTHSVANDFDYYTALDDRKPEDSRGADMLGTIDFNAACYYRYANLDLEQLRTNLTSRLADSATPNEQLVRRAVKAWLGSFIHAVPGGKQNSMAARSMPDTILVVVRDGGAWSLANAFLKPVDGVGDLLHESTRRLTGYFERVREMYGSRDLRHVGYATTLESAPFTAPLVTAAPNVADLVDGALGAAAVAAGA
jgi:CRISPR system Cascade subunit CasC